MPTNKKVVYTALYGNKDELSDPKHISEGFDYVCFTDNKDLKSDIWNIVYMVGIHSDPVRSAKIFKVLPHHYLEKYETSIWMDCNFIIRGNLNDFLNYLDIEKSRSCYFQHDCGRNCIYDEAKVIIKHKIDNPILVKKQVHRYKSKGYPKGNGLTANNIIVRKHMDEDIIKLNEIWWTQIRKYSRRDQLSLMYSFWTLRCSPNIIKESSIKLRKNKWFEYKNHLIEAQKQGY